MDFVHGFYHVNILNVIELKWNVFRIDRVLCLLICSFCDVYFCDAFLVYDYVTWIDPLFLLLFLVYVYCSNANTFTSPKCTTIQFDFEHTLSGFKAILFFLFQTFFSYEETMLCYCCISSVWILIGSHCWEEKKEKRREVIQMSAQWQDCQMFVILTFARWHHFYTLNRTFRSFCIGQLNGETPITVTHSTQTSYWNPIFVIFLNILFQNTAFFYRWRSVSLLINILSIFCFYFVFNSLWIVIIQSIFKYWSDIVKSCVFSTCKCSTPRWLLSFCIWFKGSFSQFCWHFVSKLTANQLFKRGFFINHNILIKQVLCLGQPFCRFRTYCFCSTHRICHLPPSNRRTLIPDGFSSASSANRPSLCSCKSHCKSFCTQMIRIVCVHW